MPSATTTIPRRMALVAAAASVLAGTIVAAGPASPGAASTMAFVAPLHRTASSASMPVLEPGARGSAVKLLQRKLRMQVTGYYGPITLRKVKAFQVRNGLRAAGYVGPLTWRALLASAPRASRSGGRTAPGIARVCPAPGSTLGQGWGAPRPGGRLHTGIDMPGRRGSSIVAIEDATVIRQGRQSNGALRIVLQGASGAKFYYGHMDRNLVAVGQRLSKGQVIGLMGDSGSPGAVHLHFEYWRSGGESAAVDPEPLVRSLC